MSETQKASAKKPRRSERRFEGLAGTSSYVSLAALLVGAFGLGAGVYAQWMSSVTPYYAPWLVAASCAVLSGVIVWGDFGTIALRIGDRGIAFDAAPTKMSWLAWCDIKEVRVDETGAHVDAAQPMFLSVKLYPQAIAWLVEQLRERRPAILKMEPHVGSSLPTVQQGASTLIEIDDELHLTGRRCAKSNEVITFERDGLVCARCGQVYHREHAPSQCVTCGAELRRGQKSKG